MRNAETVLGVLRERGKRRWPLERIYRLLYNPELYLLAYGRIYSNKGAMTPGVTGETADGMSMEKIERIIDALRHERYRFSLWVPTTYGTRWYSWMTLPARLRRRTRKWSKSVMSSGSGRSGAAWFRVRCGRCVL